MFIPKGTTYVSHWKAKQKIVYHSIHFDFSIQNDLFLNHDMPIQLLCNDSFDELYSLVREITEYQYKKDIDYFIGVGSFFTLCGKILKNLKSRPFQESKSPIAPAILYLKEHHTEQCNIKNLASLCYLSESRFFYLFKKYTKECGFYSAIYYRRLFKKIMGKTPTLYRKKGKLL